MWTILIIIIAAVIIWIITSNNNDNEKIRNLNLESGGLKTKFPNFTNLLQNNYNFNLKYDDGRNISFSRKALYRKTDLGELTIGIKLDTYNTLIIYSNFKCIYNNRIVNGINVSGFSDNNIESLERCISKSIESLDIDL